MKKRALLLVMAFLLKMATPPAQSISWQPLNGPNGIDVVAGGADGQGNWFVASPSTVYRSTDGGATWVAELTVPTAFSYPVGKSAFFTQPDGDVFFFGQNRLYKRGNSWQQSFNAAGASMASMSTDGQIWIGKPDGTVHHSADDGQTFSPLPFNLGLNGMDGIAAHDAGNNLLIQGTGSEVIVHRFTWAGQLDAPITLNKNLGEVQIDPASGTAFLTEGYASGHRSTDGGQSWQAMVFDPAATSYEKVTSMAFRPDGSIMAVCDGKTYRSTDGGVNWVIFLDNPAIGEANFFFNGTPGELMAFSNDAIGLSVEECVGHPFFLSQNGGDWVEASAAFTGPTTVRIQKDGDGHLYASQCQFGRMSVSGDDGQSWMPLQIFDSIWVDVLDFAHSPTTGSYFAVGGNSHIYRSLDGGANWEDISAAALANFDPLAGYYPADVRVGPTCEAFLFSNFDETAARSTDNGDTWSYLSGFISEVEGFYFLPNGDGYIKEFDNIWKYTSATGSIKQIWEDIIFLNGFFAAPNGLIWCEGTKIPIGQSGIFRSWDDGATSEFMFQQQQLPIASDAEEKLYYFDYAGGLYASNNDGTDWSAVATTPNKTGTTIFIDEEQYLYAGTIGDVIQKSAAPVANRNFIKGKTWLDGDGDCLFGAAETGRPQVAIRFDDGAKTTVRYSDAAGNFKKGVPQGSYSVSAVPPNALFSNCAPPATATLTGQADSATADAPLKAVADCPYLAVNIGIPFLRRCAENTYSIGYKNEGTAAATGAELSVELDPLFELVGAGPGGFTQNGAVLTFPLGSLAPGGKGTIKLTIKVSCDAALGQEHCLKAHITPDALCVAGLDSLFKYTDCRDNRGSWDPNEKEASVGGKAGAANAEPGQPIEYTIHFQNTGTDTAFRVAIEDRLPDGLDPATVAPSVSSHPFLMEMGDNARLRFVFDPIALPDSNVSVAGSQGFVKFWVKQKPGLPTGTELNNYANIFFDSNEPVRTNTSTVTILKTSSVPPNPSPRPPAVRAWPNPVGERFVIEIAGGGLGDKLFVMTDLLGRDCRSAIFTGERLSMERGELAPGFYFFKVSGKNGEAVGEGRLVLR